MSDEETTAGHQADGRNMTTRVREGYGNLAGWQQTGLMLGGAAAAIGIPGYIGVTREGRQPSFLDNTVGPAVGRGVDGLMSYARTEQGGQMVGWGLFGLTMILGMGTIPTIGNVGLGQVMKSMLTTTAVIAATAFVGLSLATWAQRGFEGGFTGLMEAFMDTGADAIEFLNLDDLVHDWTPIGWAYQGGQMTLDAIFGGDNTEHEFGRTVVGEGEDATTVVNDDREVRISAGEPIPSLATGRIIMANPDGVEGDDRSVVVIESPNGVFTVLRGVEGVTESLVGTEVTFGEPIEGLTSSGLLSHQLMVTYQEAGAEGDDVSAALIDPRNMADRLATEPAERIAALERAASEAELGEVVPNEFFETYIEPLMAAPTPTVDIEAFGTVVEEFSVYSVHSGHGVTYETEADAALVARGDMTVMHVEGDTMYVRYGDEVPATVGVYRNVEGIDASLVGQSYEAGQEIAGTNTGGQYDFSLVIQDGVSGMIKGFVVDPTQFSPADLVDDADARARAIADTETQIENEFLRSDPDYASSISPLISGLGIGQSLVHAYGADDRTFFRGIGIGTEDGDALVSHVGGEIFLYDTISSERAREEGIDGGGIGLSVVISHSETAGVYTQYGALEAVDASGGVGLEVEAGGELPATTGAYTDRRLVVVDPRDGQAYYVDPLQFSDVDRLVADEEYRVQAVDAAIEAAGGDENNLMRIRRVDFEVTAIEIETAEVAVDRAATVELNQFT